MSGSGDTAERDHMVITFYGDNKDMSPGEHVMICVPVDLLGSTPDTNITLYVSIIQLKKKKEKRGGSKQNLFL